LHANVIDSCIDIIVGRSVIREHHLIQKILQYFDETTSFRPDQCGDGQLAARNKIMDRYCPNWIDNNFSTQKLMQLLLMSFKEHSRVRRLEQEEDEEGMSGACLLITWRWNEKQEGPERVRRSSP